MVSPPTFIIFFWFLLFWARLIDSGNWKLCQPGEDFLEALTQDCKWASYPGINWSLLGGTLTFAFSRHLSCNWWNCSVHGNRKMKDGEHLEFNLIICATGFDVVFAPHLNVAITLLQKDGKLAINQGQQQQSDWNQWPDNAGRMGWSTFFFFLISFFFFSLSRARVSPIR